MMLRHSPDIHLSQTAQIISSSCEYSQNSYLGSIEELKALTDRLNDTHSDNSESI